LISPVNKIVQYYRKVAVTLENRGINGLVGDAKEAFKLRYYRASSQHRRLEGILNIVFRRDICSPSLDLAYLELTNNCNLNCEMCTFKKMQGRIGCMSRFLFESCVDQLSEMGVKTLYLHGGGESLLHPEFKDFLRYAIYRRDHGGIQSVAWVDNGTLFNQDIADLVVDLKVDEINFSIDGVGAVNDNIRLGAKYSVIERNIKYLITKRGEAAKPKVTIGMVSYGKTEAQKMDVYREWVPFVDAINLIPSLLPNNSWDNRTDFLDTQMTVAPPPFCRIPFQMMIVSWDGKVSGCCIDYSYRLEVGDAARESLQQIWQGSRYQALRKAMLTKTYWFGSPCQKCEFWKINFEPAEEDLLDGKATVEYGYAYRTIRKKDHTTPNEDEKS